MNIRIQSYGTSFNFYVPFFCKAQTEVSRRTKLTTTDGANVYDILEKGLQDLMDMCDVVTEKFIIAREEFSADKMQA